MNKEMKKATPVKNLICCCCDAPTRGRQWYNRDEGFGLCDDCIKFCKANTKRVDIFYGISGVHYNLNEDK